ncbi:hypothetical protein M426DRAFT_173794 [Hypoxylon sp. CI-4A]|nr:hypothetical protein M426DRAFT_173794 [Hypoxylon sp. CI-4A]
MAQLSLALKVAIGLLMVVSILELAFVSSMVAWLHRTASKGFSFEFNGSTHLLAGKPMDLMVNQGHASNGAAGTAFVLIGLGGGVVALSLRRWSSHKSGGLVVLARYVYSFWVLVNAPALLLTLAALAYVFAVTSARGGQTIDASLAAGLNGSPYPLESWTPQTWFAAVLRLDLVDARSDIQDHLRVMRGWQYNLIPMFVVQLAVTVLALWEFLAWRRQTNVLSFREK